VLYALLMVPNALLAHLFLGQRVARGFWAGSAVALAGIALLVVHEVQVAPPTSAPWLGIGMVTISILGASVANVIQASGAARSRAILPILAWAMAIGTLVDGLVALVLTGPPVIDHTWSYASGVLYLSIVGSVITFPLYFQLLKDMARAARPITACWCRWWPWAFRPCSRAIAGRCCRWPDLCWPWPGWSWR
jgi:drug/metabolite transporter (DMT)-like permease